jgi:hypothetical protein
MTRFHHATLLSFLLCNTLFKNSKEITQQTIRGETRNEVEKEERGGEGKGGKGRGGGEGKERKEGERWGIRRTQTQDTITQQHSARSAQDGW